MPTGEDEPPAASRGQTFRRERPVSPDRAPAEEERPGDASGAKSWASVALFSADACIAMSRAIREAGGDEVFFAGWRDEGDERVSRIEVLARGNAHSAPALVEAAARADVAIHNHPSGELRPSDADVSIASLLGRQATGFYIINNAATQVHVVVPIPREAREESVKVADVEAILGPGGKVAEVFPDYEAREGQGRMAGAVAQALSHKRLLLCEAGTGTGKTFAYLIPAILWATRNARAVVVSTGTINLQEQIAEKDVPFLKRVLPDFRAVLVKGRGNFVSLRRAAEAGKLPPEAFESEAERDATAELVAWAQRTRTGDRSELSPRPPPEAWERVESQSDNCLGVRCPTYRDCHYYRTRQAAKRAEVLIVNHHLLFADLAAKVEMGSLSAAAVLPPYDRVIVDEAHKLEEVAAGYFGTRLSEHGLRRRLGRLVSRKRRSKGLVTALIRKLADLPLAERAEQDRIDTATRLLEEEFGAQVFDVGDMLTLVFDLGRAALERQQEAAGDATPSLRMRPDPKSEAEQRLSEDLAEPLAEARTRVALLSARGKAVLENLDDLSEATRQPIEGLLLEFQAALKRLDGVATALEHLGQLGDRSHVRWFEAARKGRERLGTYTAAPLELAPMLRDALWDKLAGGVLTSATLTTDQGFAFLRGRLGLNERLNERVDEEVVASPFDFHEQARLMVPDDCSEVRERGFMDDVCYAIDRLTEVSRGRAFVLFTSYRMLQEVHRRLASHLRSQGLHPVVQGEASRREVLRRFMTTDGAVLFGTDSFWEGVDVPGERLSLVIVVKLPFRVPSDPLQEARAERVEAEGKRAFEELMLPEAILRLRQGFGRLVRTRKDRGIVVILDRRVLTKSYGRRVLLALPPAPRIIGPLERRLLPESQAFFGDRT